MLVLSREVGQRVLLSVRGVEVWLSVVDVRGAGANASVRLGLDGPPEAVFTREELLGPRREGDGRAER
jgi:sRNA-binding carbon storage regulator CsrA